MSEENLNVTPNAGTTDENVNPPADADITPTPVNDDVVPTEGANGEGTPDTKKPDDGTKPEEQKTFNQEQLNEIVQNRLERERNSIFSRYGVKDRDALDVLMGKAQSYDALKEKFDAQSTEIADLKEKLAFVHNDISPDREDDIRAYFKGKDLEFNEEALKNALETHPEWRNVVKADETPKTTIRQLGVEHGIGNVPETETEKMTRVFGV
jgi:DNA-directed RNA polymerase subunit F